VLGDALEQAGQKLPHTGCPESSAGECRGSQAAVQPLLRLKSVEVAEDPVQGTDSLLGQTMRAAYETVMPMARAVSELMDDTHHYSPLRAESDAEGMEELQTTAASTSTGMRTTMTVRPAPKFAFAPASYAPDSHETGKLASYRAARKLFSRQDQPQPGRLPAKVFVLATSILISLWASGLVLPCKAVRELMTKPVLAAVPMEEMPGQGKSGLTDAGGFPMFVSKDSKPLRDLPAGERIEMKLPHRSGFFPHSFSSDAAGEQLILADDISLYVARLSNATEHEPGAAGATASGSMRALGVEPARPVLAARFRRMAPCLSLEGQALKDASVGCTASGQREPTCRVFVLLDHGKALAECPLLPFVGSHRTAGGRAAVARAQRGARAEQNLTWQISNEWLHSAGPVERVDSLAIDSECLSSARSSDPGSCSFGADKMGCVVIGTTFGRIVQLRGNIDNEHLLVPERSIHQQLQPVTHGSLQVLSSGFIVALSRKALGAKDGKSPQHVQATVKAFERKNGTLVGEWQLPAGVDWMLLAGGRHSLFALGLREQRRMELHRFPMPPKLVV